MLFYEAIDHFPVDIRATAELWLWPVNFEPDEKPDHERRTFDCPRCEHQMVTVVKVR
jgi:hypothetical protein